MNPRQEKEATPPTILASHSIEPFRVRKFQGGGQATSGSDRSSGEQPKIRQPKTDRNEKKEVLRPDHSSAFVSKSREGTHDAPSMVSTFSDYTQGSDDWLNGDFRIISISKLPPKANNPEQDYEKFLAWDALDDFSDPWARPPPELNSADTKKKVPFRQRLPLLMCSMRKEQSTETPPVAANKPHGLSSTECGESVHGSYCFDEDTVKRTSTPGTGASRWFESSGAEVARLWESPERASEETASRICDVFTEQLVQNNEQELPPIDSSARTPPASPGGHDMPLPSPSSLSQLTSISSGSLASSSRSGELKNFTPPRTQIASMIERFGGAAKQKKAPTVQRRKAQLEKLWAKDRLPHTKKKTMWQVSNGSYKKSIVLDTVDDI